MSASTSPIISLFELCVISFREGTHPIRVVKKGIITWHVYIKESSMATVTLEEFIPED